MDIKVETISPEVAEALLATNTKNRPVNERHVSFLLDQMNKGLWQNSGDPIRISSDNVLLDGQHRLIAMLRAGKTYEMVIIRGLPPETFEVMDTGRVRQAHEILFLGGHENARLAASVVRSIVNYQRGITSNTLVNQGRHGGLAVTNTEVREFMEAIDLQPSMRRAKVFYNKNKQLTPSEWSFFYFVFSGIDADAAELFLSRLSTGIELTEKSPIYQLRIRLEKYKLNKLTMTPTAKLACVFKAWNLYRQGKQISLLTWSFEKEGFPLPQ